MNLTRYDDLLEGHIKATVYREGLTQADLDVLDRTGELPTGSRPKPVAGRLDLDEYDGSTPLVQFALSNSGSEYMRKEPRTATYSLLIVAADRRQAMQVGGGLLKSLARGGWAFAFDGEDLLDVGPYTVGLTVVASGAVS